MALGGERSRFFPTFIDSSILPKLKYERLCLSQLVPSESELMERFVSLKCLTRTIEQRIQKFWVKSCAFL